MRLGKAVLVGILGGILVVTLVMACHAEESGQINEVVIVNATDETIDVFFLGEDGSRGTSVPPHLGVVMPVDPERGTLEVKAAGCGKRSVPGVARHTFRLKDPKESRQWSVTPDDL